MQKIKTPILILTLFAVAIVFSGFASYVYAQYVDPSGTPPSDNAPAFITDDANPVTKMGKFFLNFTAKPLDEGRMKDNTLIVPGLTSTVGLAATSVNILGHLETSSNLVPFLFGSPTDSALVQTSGGKVRTFQVEDTGHTRAPRYVVGSKTKTPNVNLYLTPGYASTNLGITSRSVIVNTNDFKNNGCPEDTYLNKIVFDNNNNATATCNYFSR
jgi:hypothetical protein